jgi:hypothetical protein
LLVNTNTAAAAADAVVETVDIIALRQRRMSSDEKLLKSSSYDFSIGIRKKMSGLVVGADFVRRMLFSLLCFVVVVVIGRPTRDL